MLSARRAAAAVAAAPPHPRQASSTTSFYTNRILESYVALNSTRVSLRQLCVFGRSVSADKLVRSANYIRSELPIRLAHRIARFQQLPFVVGMNPHIELIYNLYWDAFDKFRSVPPITTIDANREFCALIQSTLNAHLVAIPQLAIGIAESEPHLPLHAADRFMNETLRSRIGRRVLAEQHIALSAIFDGSRPLLEDWIGIVHSRCRALDTIQKCASLASAVFRDAYGVPAPNVIIDGYRAATFIYIPDHIEYILFELLKNSMRFTLERHEPHVALKSDSIASSYSNTPASASTPMTTNTDSSSVLASSFHPAEEALARARSSALNPSAPVSPSHQPIYSAASAPPFTHSSTPPSPASTSHSPSSSPRDAIPEFSSHLPPIRVTIGQADTQIMFRISDQGGGIDKSILSQIWSYSHTSKRRLTRHDFDQIPHLAAKVGEPIPPNIHLGLGLPMSRVYANYWGGDISLYTMEGYGTDVYVSISIGNQAENLAYDDDLSTPLSLSPPSHSIGSHSHSSSGSRT